MQENQHLFVYGSLLSGFRHPAYEYMSKYFTLVSEAKIKGLLFDLGEYPAARPTVEEHYIHGELYRLNNEQEFSWAFSQLDDYEGVNAEEDEVQLYRREEVTVFVNEKTTTAWVYWYNGDVAEKAIIPSGDVIDYFQHKTH